jgi:methylenetetrahydrofolate reductase (NADPH)
MLVADAYRTQRPCFSFEFFPPKRTEDWDQLFITISRLSALRPACVSVTYGAGGGTRDRTHQLLVRIKEQTDLHVVSHLTTVGSTRDEIWEILDRYDQAGIHNILALRGDPPKGQTDFVPAKDGFPYAADLVAFIRRKFPHMGIGVAGFPEGHPATPNRLKEIEYLRAKIDAGADYIVTQLFFDNRDFYDFRERCELEGIRVPIVAGIMPILTISGMVRMAELAAGARFPGRLLKAVRRASSDDGVASVGVHWATEQVRDLIDQGVAGIHFYTLNQSKATLEIYKSLGVQNSAELAGKKAA